jgi:hypothetical protein
MIAFVNIEVKFGKIMGLTPHARHFILKNALYEKSISACLVGLWASLEFRQRREAQCFVYRHR